MKPFVRAHYPDARNRVKIEIQWPPAELMTVAHQSGVYRATTIPYCFFWFDADSDDLVAMLEGFPPNEIRENPLRAVARLNGLDDSGSNDDLIDRLATVWEAA